MTDEDRIQTAPLPVQTKDGNVAVWLGCAPPVRSVRWVDGALAAAARFARDGGTVTAVAAGAPAWLDLAADRATRAGVASAGVPTDLRLDYLGWAQIAVAAARALAASTVVVDEASRPERAPEVAAIAELLDIAQLTRVVALAPDGAVVHASRLAGAELQTIRVRGPAVFGVRIAGPPIDEHPTPMPSTSMRRLELEELRLDAAVLGHRALPPRSGPSARKNVARVAEYLALHAPARPGESE